MKFEQKEIDNAVVSDNTEFGFLSHDVTFDSPISRRENFRRALRNEAVWMPSRKDCSWFCPEIIPDNIARAFVIEGGDPYTGPVGGNDMFGVYWEYVPATMGSITRPGNPTIKDISQWKSLVHFPDLDTWDWEGSALKNREHLKNSDTYVNLCVFTGFFERLIAFMDFGPAAYALMNRKQQPYVKEFFEALSDFWCDLVDHADKYYGHDLDGFAFHDDWGAQHSPFFNARTVNEMLVPYMKKVTDHIHELGYTCELHSCGKNDLLVECIGAAGWDSWENMTINDPVYDQDHINGQYMFYVAPPNVKDTEPLDVQVAAAKQFVDQFGDRKRQVAIATFTDNDTAPSADFLKEVYRLTRNLYDVG